ncbi:daunorubicin resistance protein DrrA family ABC transporter ATP-binding protein [Kibdelosporangium lantanae]
MTAPSVTVEGLRKSFGGNTALAGVDFAVYPGEVFALLGPNGAGKTTAVRIISTLLRPDSGRVCVHGADVTSDPAAVRRHLGLSGQYSAVDGRLTGFENVRLIARLRGLRRQRAAAVAADQLARFRLTDVANRLAGTYSGGMRRRLDLAAALVCDPPVVVLDEPTTGLDPQSRLDMWEVVEDLVAHGTAVLLTTQYLEEADRLSDRVCVIDHGRVVAAGTGDELKDLFGGSRIEVLLPSTAELPAAQRILAEVGTAEPVVDPRAESRSR